MPTPEPKPEPVPVDGQAETALGTPAAVSPDGWLGRVLDDRYRITERLGEGGMGAVFVAQHLKLHKLVALKVIRAELAGNGEVAARFAREAMATAQFEHPHVASAIDYGTLPEGGAYLVMQLVRGRALRDLLETHKRLPWPQACELLAQAADALSAARGVGIVHRDLKPENMLVEVREDGTELVKLLDFGIAHVSPRQAPEGDPHAPPGALVPTRELTRIGVVMGTPGYMSPEQAVGGKVDHRTDLYALGVVLWECIAGQPLWDGPDVTAIITRQMQGPVPRLRDQLGDPSIPRELDDLIQRLCAREAEGRPEHAGAVRDELRALSLRRSRPSLLPEGATLAFERSVMRVRAWPRPAQLLAGVAVVALALLAAWGSLGPREGDTNVAAEAKVEAPQVVPSALEADAKSLTSATKLADRRKAAQNVLAFNEPKRVPPYLLAIARLENARGCKDRKDAIRELSELGDARGLDTLRRLAGSSKTGCGFLDLEDCYGCIRVDLRRAIDTLEAKPDATRAP